MLFHGNTTMDGLQSAGIPTFSTCEHYLIQPHPGTEQTIVIQIEGGAYLTVNIRPKSDNVDVQMHSPTYKSQEFGEIRAFYNMNGGYAD